MAVIHMDTDEVNQLVGRIRTAVNEFVDSYSSLSANTNRLPRDWYGGSADRFVRRTNRSLKKLAQGIDRLDILEKNLRAEIDQWLQIDSNSRQAIRRSSHPSFLLPAAPEDFPQQMDNIIRQMDMSGKKFLLAGTMISGTGLASLSLGNSFNGWSAQSILQYSAMYENGELSETWPEEKQNKWVEAKATLYEHDFGTAQAAVISGQKGSELSGYDYAVLSAEASGSASAEYNDGTLRAGAEGQAGVYLAKISGNTGIDDIPLGPATAGLAVAGTAYVGAEVCGEAKAVFDPKSGEVSAKLGGEAFAGGKIAGEAEASLGLGGVEGTGKVNASLNYGIGAQANADIGFNQGTIKADIQFGATLGLGFDVGFSLELNTTEAVNNVMSATQSVLKNIF
jgi:uncharacterized protein YukE